MESIILKNSEQEVVMLGDYVGVCWNVEEVEKRITGEDGLIYKTKVWERKSEPYIDFIWIREYDDGMYKDEDSPVVGGLNVETSKKIIEELEKAIKYLEEGQSN